MARIVISELLCFLINNRQSFENLLFHSTVSEFYTHDEISAARKTIFGDFDTLKTENFKGTHSGNTKKERLLKLLIWLNLFLIINWKKECHAMLQST